MTNLILTRDSRRSPTTSRRAAAWSRPRGFGRRPPIAAPSVAVRPTGLTDDLRLFGATFAAGFVFVSVLLV